MNTVIPLFLKNEVFPYDKGTSIMFSYEALNKIQKFYQRLLEENKLDITVQESLYKQYNRFELKNIYPEQYQHQLQFIYDKFFPLVKRSDILCDMGCASGELTQFFSLHFKEIHAFDFSQSLINCAKADFQKLGIKNTVFDVADITNYNYTQQYDQFCLMGVFTCIFDDQVFIQALEKISNAIKHGGYLLYKDNLQDTEKDYYFFGPDPQYSMIARSKKKVLSFFEKNNFELVEETIFHCRGDNFIIKNTEYPAYYSYGGIFRKK